MRDLAVGIDIGGGSTTVGIVNRTNGKVVHSNCNDPELSLITTDYATPKSYTDALCRVINALIDKAGGINQIEGIGIGAPNGSYLTGKITNPPNLPWKEFDIVKMVEERIALQVYLDNDANCAALGEWLYGGAKGKDVDGSCKDKRMQHFVMITLGTGLGSGIVSEGKLLRGKHGFAGELGHVIVRRNEGRKCGCGRYGCVETYCSAKGLARTAIEFLDVSKKDEDNPSKFREYYLERKAKGLGDKNKEDMLITSKDVCDFAKEGDPTAKEIFEYTGKILGDALADFVAFSDPEKIFIFGGLANAGEFILEPAIRYMNQSLLSIYKGNVEVEISQLNSNSLAAVLGASALLWEGK
ncbi:ROK family protein [Dysgonomonas sp. 520]|uniref:ROK family protein n=1 Tax=Dysgonomonas sp. 520 TaxID=2302931 RepID=UPI0013D2CE69|nr:ROK family protein [Dysgonomonas sp. 520]NDW08392.1 ROK family protein [Dysgonomonas sp. 520]